MICSAVIGRVVTVKYLKKIIAVLVSVALCLSILGIAASAEDTLNYLVLGDSIAQGFGIKNPDEASYGAIVADTNHYNYKNRGVMGRDSEYLYKYLTTDEGYQEDIKWADIISVSIGGNDFLLDHAALLIAQGIIFNDYSKFDKIGETFYENFSKCMDQIHSLNPDAVILVQTLYTSWRFDFAKRPYKQAAKRINDAIEKYCAEKPENMYIVETGEAFENHSELISSDTIHPSAAGNVVLARLVLARLHEIGLGEATEPVVATPGIDRDYLVEYFGSPWGQIIIFLANLATGNFNFVFKF